MQKLVNTAQIADFLGMQASTIRKWTHYGYIPHIKMGRSVRFDLEAIEQWVRDKAQPGRETLTPTSDFRTSRWTPHD